MKKIIVVLILLSITLLAVDNIKRIKVHTIEGRLSPINIYEVCLGGVIYFVLADGYKAGMSPKFTDHNGTLSVKRCRHTRDNQWVVEK